MRYGQWNIGNEYIEWIRLNDNDDGSPQLVPKKFKVPDCRIKKLKNLYLSLYEKTYLENTFLTTLHLIILNCDTATTTIQLKYYNKILLELNLNKDIFIYNYDLVFNIWAKVELWQIKLLEINKTNPELLKLSQVLHLFEYEYKYLDMSIYYLVRFFDNDFGKFFKLEKKKTKWWSMKDYKDNIKLISLLRWNFEESIVWNKDFMKYFSIIEEEKKKNRCSKKIVWNCWKFSKS